MMTIKITGVDEFNRFIRKIHDSIPSIIKDVTIEQSDILWDLAMAHLNSSVRWGHSVHGDSINDKKYKKYTGKGYSCDMELGSTSKHAMIVEVGGMGRILDAGDYGHKAWPIGASQGGGVFFSKTVRLQSGYSYLRNAVEQRREPLVNAYAMEIARRIYMLGGGK